MMALEELSEADERLSFLTTQREDITQGISATEEALREIKRRSRERFRDALKRLIRTSVSSLTSCLAVVAAEMSLIDDDNDLESGIDIVAQPPGQASTECTVASGGEKAMAALACAGNIFPVPALAFCLLDEVDVRLMNQCGPLHHKVVAIVGQHSSSSLAQQTHNGNRPRFTRDHGRSWRSKLVSVRFE